GGRPLAHSALVVEEENEERRERDLREEVEPTSAAQHPEARVPERPFHVLGLELPCRRRGLTNSDRRSHRSHEAERAEECKRSLQPAGAVHRRQRERGYRAADGNRGLPEPEREAALLGAEPLHDGAAAR